MRANFLIRAEYVSHARSWIRNLETLQEFGYDQDAVFGTWLG